MSSRNWRERVRDILDAIAEIQDFLGTMDFDTFRQDLRTIRAVEMNFIVIGEAAAAIPEDIQEEYSHVPWHLMRGMRNRIVHAYFSVDDAIVWTTTHDDLPALAIVLQELL
ncbi:MAG: DUF86 domain-containing protein [Caldilineales bacterium]|nr:DUF86 domain-containing protein [Caldilineales bacterium]